NRSLPSFHTRRSSDLELNEIMTKPSSRFIQDIKKIHGDIMILGIGGKMGPSMAKLAKRAIDAANINKRVIGVSRFSSGTLKEELDRKSTRLNSSHVSI